MEASGIVYRTVPRLPATRVDFGGRLSRELNLGVLDSKVSVRSRNSCGRLSCRFSDSGHVQYYVSPRAGASGTKKKDKEKSSQMKAVKKKLKFIEKLSKDLSMLPQMAAGGDIRIGLVAEVKQEASHVLDSECGEVVDMKSLRTNALKSTPALKRPEEEDIEAPRSVTEAAKLANSVTEQVNKKLQGPEEMGASASAVTEEATLANYSLMEHLNSSPQIQVRVPSSSECCSSNGFRNDESKKIEICMGGKCKKLGAAALLEEFERKVGAEATVVSCKCMGKCKTAPNVRVKNSASGMEALRSNVGINPTCTGVGLQDVDLIVANLLGQDVADEWLMLSP
ncbi:Thioredoxin-like protein [Corchorus olitorius]|uniref:Thioredoxin-like protein n=1 Tax=Corchorus olitorius TaxID=93759 RepID=A0A1R3II84_9ROSI|nr:Thioredoxin-like protein [Corchorus olitorius]